MISLGSGEAIFLILVSDELSKGHHVSSCPSFVGKFCCAFERRSGFSGTLDNSERRIILISPEPTEYRALREAEPLLSAT